METKIDFLKKCKLKEQFAGVDSYTYKEFTVFHLTITDMIMIYDKAKLILETSMVAELEQWLKKH